MTTTVHTSTVPADTLRAISLVGRVVTYRDRQYTCHSVEGVDFFAFRNLASDTITVDLGMTPSPWHREATAMLIPMGCQIGQGFGQEVPVSLIRAGVCLAK